MAQFDYHTRDNLDGFVVEVQHGQLEDIKTRVVVPLLRASLLPERFPRLNPVFEISSRTFVLVPQLIATLGMENLRHSSGSLAKDRDRIIAALDFLFTGF